MDNRKHPLQKRSKDTVESILLAAKSIIINEGVVNFNTNNIAKKAGVSIGCIYQYFNSKEGILTALVSRDLARKLAVLEEKFSIFKGYPFEEKVKETINILFDLNETGKELVTAGKYLQIKQMRKFQIDFQRDVVERAKLFLSNSADHISMQKIESAVLVFFQSINSEIVKDHQERMKTALFHLSSSYLQN